MASMVKKKTKQNTFKPVALLLEWSLPGPFRGSEREMFSWFVLTHFSLDREVRSQSHRSSSKSQRLNPSEDHTMNSFTDSKSVSQILLYLISIIYLDIFTRERKPSSCSNTCSHNFLGINLPWQLHSFQTVGPIGHARYRHLMAV